MWLASAALLTRTTATTGGGEFCHHAYLFMPLLFLYFPSLLLLLLLQTKQELERSLSELIARQQPAESRAPTQDDRKDNRDGK
jgi:hypothetical protein